MRRTELKRTQPLKRGPGPKRTGGLAPISKRSRKRDAGYPAARKAVHAREGGCCQVNAPGCRGVVDLDQGHTHHLAGRLGPDPHRLENLTWMCPPCHWLVHAHPGWSYEVGWMVRRNGGAA